ncbi:MAG: DUF488 family protein [Rickettsiales bacterium]|jgi:uncharacterized protein YeaO (DUF488 family)|nr:DUF488 family protein [Rickettsiales bacterium]
MQIHVKRIYDDWSKADGFRVLVDRLWPHGISQTDAHIDMWIRDIAPTNTGDMAWEKFQKTIKSHDIVTLVTTERDTVSGRAARIKKMLQGC